MSDVINDCSVLLSYYCNIYVLLLIFYILYTNVMMGRASKLSQSLRRNLWLETEA